MQVIKTILIIALLFTIIGASAYVGQRYLASWKLNERFKFLQVFQPAVNATFGHAGKVTASIDSAGKVLGAKDEAASKPKTPAHQRAFEKIRYEYCQQVMVDFQNRYPVSEEKSE